MPCAKRGSEGWPSGTVTCTTLGDPESFPRRRGLPNTFDPVFDALDAYRELPDLYTASRKELLSYLSRGVSDGGAIMLALRSGSATPTQLKTRVSLPEDRCEASVQLLTAIGYRTPG